MKFNRKDLLDILSVIRPAVAKREVIEQQKHFIFLGDKVAATNGNIFITHPLVTDFKSSVKAEDLFKILAASSADEVDISVGKDKVKIVSKDTRSSLSTIIDGRDRVDDLIQSLESDMGDWLMLPEDFCDALWLVAFSASKNMSDGVIVAVSIEGENVMTTDSKRTSWYKLSDPVDPFLMGANDALELSNLVVGEYCLTDNWCHFRTENGATFSARRMAGKHLPLVELFNSLDEGMKFNSFPPELKSSVEAATVLVDNAKSDPSKTITVSISNGEIVCRAEDERGYIEKIVTTEQKDINVQFQINPYFLTQILEKSTDMSIHTLSRKSNTFKVAVFTSGNFKHLVQLPAVQGV